MGDVGLVPPAIYDLRAKLRRLVERIPKLEVPPIPRPRPDPVPVEKAGIFVAGARTPDHFFLFDYTPKQEVWTVCY